MNIETYSENIHNNNRILNKSYKSVLDEMSNEEKELIKKRGNFLLRQELADLTPLESVKCIIIYNFITMTVFLLLGVLFLTNYDEKNYIEINYTNCTKIFEESEECEINFDVQKKIKGPVYIYYKLMNFYNNHIEYVKSKNFDQLRGEIISESRANKTCEDFSINKQLKDYQGVNSSLNGRILDDYKVLDPCGKIARSLFNDSYQLFFNNSVEIPIKNDSICRKIDKLNFKNSLDYMDFQYINKEDEHFMNWMNMEIFPNFIKKWGNINVDLEKGKYKLKIYDRWGKKEWDIHKYFVIAKGSDFGKEKFFGYVLAISACLTLFIIIIVSLRFIRQEDFCVEKMMWKRFRFF